MKDNMRIRVVILFAIFVLLGVLAASLFAATTFSGKIRIQPTWAHSKVDVTTVTETFPYALYTFTHTSGTNADQMNLLWHESVTISAKGTNDFDLDGLVTNAFGEALDFVDVRLLFFSASSTNAGSVNVGGGPGALEGWLADVSDLLILKPGGVWFTCTPDTVGYSVGTNGGLRVVNTNATGVTVTIYAGGSDD